jgi:rifampicin phosphotransferase
MKKLPFAWLGSKRAQKQGAGDKASLLDLGRRLGLPVPEGVVLLHRLYALLLEAGVIVKENGRIHCPDPVWLKQVLTADVRLPLLSGPMVVRAAFATPDSRSAAAIAPQLDVNFDDSQAVADALCDLWTAVSEQPDTFRRDLIIQKPVSIRNEGVLFSDPAYQDDLVCSGQYSLFSDQYSGDGEQVLLPQLRRGEQAEAGIPPFGQRLQMLLRGVRHTFGQGAWRVEWADDGQICWLLQINPLTQPPIRPDLFMPATLNGLLPERPSPAVSKRLVAASADLYDLFRDLDSSLPANRSLVQMVAERPSLNQSLLTDTMRHWGLPTAPVSALLGGANGRPAGRRWGRGLRRGWLMLRLGRRQLRTASQASSQAARWRRRAAETAGEETAVSHTLTELWIAALTAHLCLLGPLSPAQPRLAQAQTIWREETAAALSVLNEKLARPADLTP